MHRLTLTAFLATLAVAVAALAPRLAPAPAPVAAAPQAPEAPPPQIVTPPPATTPGATLELVFALDTTSSMTDLIEGAKDTIWSVVNDFAAQKPTPEIRVGLVAYRDRGDSYVTQVVPLTRDLDAVYEALTGLRAEGGGDEPESVTRALIDAIDAQPWTVQDPHVFRSIFVVGDAADKGYGDEPAADAVVARARERGIWVNAIVCGDSRTARRAFERLAVNGGGTFAAVAQDGAVARRDTPMDARLEVIERELAATALTWGSTDEKAIVAKKIELVAGSSASVKASRRSALAKYAGKTDTIVTTSDGKGDLLDDLRDRKVALDAIPEEELPDELKDLDAPARQQMIADRAAHRQALANELATLTKDRDTWLAEQRSAEAAAAPSYDRTVVEGSIEKLRELHLVE